jgi:hypothetical protein
MQDCLNKLNELSKENPYLEGERFYIQDYINPLDIEEEDDTSFLDDFFVESGRIRAELEQMGKNVDILKLVYSEILDQIDTELEKKSTTDADILVDTINQTSRKIHGKLEVIGKSLPKHNVGMSYL